MGYYGGDPEKVLNGRVDLVMKILDYEVFIDQYESTWSELNKAGNK